jgi:hypothetical protein
MIDAAWMAREDAGDFDRGVFERRSDHAAVGAAASSFGAGLVVSRQFSPLRRDFEQHPSKVFGVAEE